MESRIYVNIDSQTHDLRFFTYKNSRVLCEFICIVGNCEFAVVSPFFAHRDSDMPCFVRFRSRKQTCKA